MVRVFANGSGDQGSIFGRVIPKTQKMVLDAALLNLVRFKISVCRDPKNPTTESYKVQIKDNVKQSREWSSALPYTSVS